MTKIKISKKTHGSKDQPTNIPEAVVTQTSKRRPSLDEVIATLAAQGRNDVAEKIQNLSGISGKVLEQPKSQGKFRFAYIYLNQNIGLEKQSARLEQFVTVLQSRKNARIDKVLHGSQIIPVTLPRNFVVLALRVLLDDYLESPIPNIVEKSKDFKAYLRKPRSDTQHLAKTSDKPETQTE